MAVLFDASISVELYNERVFFRNTLLFKESKKERRTLLSKNASNVSLRFRRFHSPQC